ncbi:hypothetical protein [Roseivirga pacifica]|uniref:hypothetical protein n=1 Tax=Roseivirga pacifica TaxID=1267423 RepID=UPI0020941B88|nr:hypothetical protein [Roseivirga pacifica]MCO6358490.1 hypothetical protein [Roseivirga pacifica]MCO6369045.1 hypothetical protein [Roseivirga pacifica]MCO6372251.1 hypothetical protein [Roseivirga pacifica]MCO6374221.1 hypothetical protein [Roseivirga pacifica]MCO6380982.1 hypothetical protein [Roseivirga pacifica]
MKTHANQTPQNASRANGHAIADTENRSEATFQFVDNRPETAAQRKLKESINEGKVAQRYPYIGSTPPERKDAQIYGIFEMNNGVLGDCIYVGQTTDVRAGDRFVEHVQNDNWAPWFDNGVNDYRSNNDGDWPYVPRELEGLKDVTKFEVTAAEQWWIDHKGGKDNLQNRVNALTRVAFDFYKNINGNYDHTNIGVNANWHPLN